MFVILLDILVYLRLHPRTCKFFCDLVARIRAVINPNSILAAKGTSGSKYAKSSVDLEIDIAKYYV